MSLEIKDLSEKIKNLNTFRKGDRRAPHKPLLLLIAIAEFQKGKRELKFDEVKTNLLPLLLAYAPPVKSRHQPELPYWYLCSDGLWDVYSSSKIQYQKGGFPTISSLKNTSGGLKAEILELLKRDSAVADIIISQILNEYFPPSVHDELLDRIGFIPSDEPEKFSIEDEPAARYKNAYRDPEFRKSVLRAYEHECVVTGFRASLNGTYFGCEAAHIKWHAYNGPDSVSNGVSLEPTMHKLLDAGAWTLTDDRRVLVSAEYTGSGTAIERLRKYHGQAIKSPITGERPVSVEFIKWHRLAKQGGVFREPALALD